MIPVDELKCCRIFDELDQRELEEVAKLGTHREAGGGLAHHR